MPLPDETLIKRSGALDIPSKWLGIVPKQRAHLPEVGRGERIVALDASGRVVPQGTPGQRVFGSAVSYVVVDTSVHRLNLHLQEIAATEFGSLDTDVQMSARVVDAEACVDSGASSIRDVTEARLRAWIRRSFSRDAVADKLNSSGSSMLGAKAFAESELSKLTEDCPAIFPDWCTVAIDNIEVQFAQQTRTHFNSAQALRQETAIATLRRDESSRRMAFWRSEFENYVPKRTAKVLALAMMDPSREHVDDAMRAIREGEQRDFLVVLDAFKAMVGEHMVGDESEAVHAVVERIRSEVSGGKGAALPQASRPLLWRDPLELSEGAPSGAVEDERP